MPHRCRQRGVYPRRPPQPWPWAGESAGLSESGQSRRGCSSSACHGLRIQRAKYKRVEQLPPQWASGSVLGLWSLSQLLQEDCQQAHVQPSCAVNRAAPPIRQRRHYEKLVCLEFCIFCSLPSQPSDREDLMNHCLFLLNVDGLTVGRNDFRAGTGKLLVIMEVATPMLFFWIAVLLAVGSSWMHRSYAKSQFSALVL